MASKNERIYSLESTRYNTRQDIKYLRQDIEQLRKDVAGLTAYLKIRRIYPPATPPWTSYEKIPPKRKKR